MKLACIVNRIKNDRFATAIGIIQNEFVPSSMIPPFFRSAAISEQFTKFYNLWRQLGAHGNFNFYTVVAVNESSLFREIERKVSMSTTEIHVFFVKTF